MALANKVDRFLTLMNDRGASDLHLSVGRPPMFRLHGDVESIRFRVLNNHDFVEFIKPLMSPKDWQQFRERGDADFLCSMAHVRLASLAPFVVWRRTPSVVWRLTLFVVWRWQLEVARMRITGAGQGAKACKVSQRTASLWVPAAFE